MNNGGAGAGLFLIDADTDEPIANLTGNPTLDRRELPPHLNIEATTQRPRPALGDELAAAAAALANAAAGGVR